MAGATVCCAIQAEVVALREAIDFVKGRGISSCTFYTDNESLARDCTDLQPPLNADWRAFRDMYEIWKSLKECNFVYRHISRSQNSMTDHLAKAGRELEECYTGYTYPTLLP